MSEEKKQAAANQEDPKQSGSASSPHQGKAHDGRGGHEGHEGHGDGDHQSHHAHMAQDFKNRLWVCLALTVPILILSPMIQGIFGFKEAVDFPGDTYILLALSAAVFVYGGKPFLKGLVDELKQKQPGMMTLIGLAICVAFFYSAAVALGVKGRVFFWELATLIDVMLLGHYIEMKSVMGAGKALDELAKLMPTTAHRLKEDGSTEDVPVKELSKGDRFRVKPGEKAPTDGRVIEGRSKVDESAVTGESKPVDKEEGDEVIGGTLNHDGALVVEVEKVGEETFISQVIKTVRESQEAKSQTQNLADKAAFWLTIIAVTVGVITLIAWLTLGREFVYAMERMVSVMVITCPHALGLAIPLVVAVSTSLGAQNGLLVRDRTQFEGARNIDLVVFDKTGTLTKGQFGVTGVIPAEGVEENEVLRLAAALESQSEHPLAQGIVAEALNRDIHAPDAKNFEAMKGKGVKGRVEGDQVFVVSPQYLKDQGIGADDLDLKEHYNQGHTVVFVLKNDQLMGAAALGDVIRDESYQAVKTLKSMNVTPMMITGDKEEVAQAVAEALGLAEYMAEVLPEDKKDKVKELKGRGRRVAMTGDGVNDAPALAEADLGVAVGAGTDVAIETADVVLVRSDPRDVVNIIKLSKATYTKMVQNLFWATGYNVVAIPLAAGVLIGYGIVISPALGAAIMSLSTVITAFNAKLLSFEGRGES